MTEEQAAAKPHSEYVQACMEYHNALKALKIAKAKVRETRAECERLEAEGHA